jgi:hypothetical protein
MMKTGHVEKTVDRDYEIEERRYRTMESAANKLQREAKGYLDSLRGTNPKPDSPHSLCSPRFPLSVADVVAMTAAQTRIAETIDAFYGEAGTSDNRQRIGASPSQPNHFSF